MSSITRHRARTVHSFISAALASSAAASTLLLSACGSDNSGSTTTTPPPPPPPATVTLSGVVAASGFVPGSTSGNPTLKAGYYQGAVVCIDANSNGKCDSGETSATTDATGKFSITTAQNSDLLADIGTSATNTATGATVTSRLALRASLAQVTAAATAVVISPMSSEVQRLVEQNSSDFATEQANLAKKVGVSGTQVLADFGGLSGAAQTAVLTESNALANRYTYATAKFDRGDLYPDALAVAGNDPELAGLTNVTAGTAPTGTDSRKPITFLQAQQAAFNIEGIPRYDAIFIVMLENEGTQTILGSSYAPNINKYLTEGNQFSTYFSTGNPSEPNYTALGGADDFGIVDDNWWGCSAGVKGDASYPTDVDHPANLTASDGQPLPATTAVPAATKTDATGNHSPLSGATGAACLATPAADNQSVNHNINSDSLFTLISKSGLTWRTYSESMNPGQDPRVDSVGDNALVGAYVGAGSVDLQPYTAPDGLYKTKHHPGMAYQSVRNLPEFFADNRTIFGTQYGTAQLEKSTAYPIPAGYNYDQFSTDLASGDVGNLNFIMPDQCDDMHGVGSDPSCSSNTSPPTGSPAGTVPPVAHIIARGDDYVRQVVEKIQASPLWSSPQKHVAIVLMFDEGKATAGFNSCCGWVQASAAGAGVNPVTVAADGTVTSTPVTNYDLGNHGHGNSIFAVLTNVGPTGVKDSDVYSHFSFVRTLQDMFQLADPAKDGSYLNRAKYTEKFIAQNILNLPEYAGSADTHFDAVRPMNHAYAIPAAYTQKQSSDIATPAQVGPDANQTNIWATSK